jgi:hypothetical protein
VVRRARYNRMAKIRRPKTDVFIFKTDEFTVNLLATDEFKPSLVRRIYRVKFIWVDEFTINS